MNVFVSVEDGSVDDRALTDSLVSQKHYSHLDAIAISI